MKDYDATVDVELDAVEKFVLQCLAFYQVPKDVFFVNNPEVDWIERSILKCYLQDYFLGTLLFVATCNDRL